MTYTNPILCGFYPDPSICRVHEDYYLVCSSFAYLPGIPLFHSRDLVHWTLLTHVLNRPSQFDPGSLGVSKGVFAPTIRYHRGLFYLTCTFVDAGGNFLVTATDPAGPWSDPVWLPINGIDPSLYFDEDEQAWIVYNSVAPGDRPLYNGHRTIRMRRFDRQRLLPDPDERILVNGGTQIGLNPRWIEGPHLYKRKGWYYLLAAEGGTGYDHAVVLFRSRSLDEPFLPYEGNPLLAGDRFGTRPWPITSAGHADLVDTPEGNWHAVFLACRPYDQDHYNTGRETFLVPVNWTGEWPAFIPGSSTIAYRYPLPLPPTGNSQAPYSGNFEWADEFEGPDLGPDWIFLRQPDPTHYDLHARPGWLALTPAPDTLDGRGSPTFLCRRQQHLHARVGIRIEFEPRAENERGGLAVFQDSGHYYLLAVFLEGEEKKLGLFRSLLLPRNPGRAELLSSLALPAGLLDLCIEANADVYRFSFRAEHGHWQDLGGDQPAAFLSTCTAGGFTGCVFGIYATSTGQNSSNRIYADRFTYAGNDPIWQDPGPGDS